jgi:hypothetical protein
VPEGHAVHAVSLVDVPDSVSVVPSEHSLCATQAVVGSLSSSHVPSSQINAES